MGSFLESKKAVLKLIFILPPFRYRPRLYLLGLAFVFCVSLIALLLARSGPLESKAPVLLAEQMPLPCTVPEPQEWDGAAKKLEVNQGVTLNPTPKGDLVVAVQNLSTMADLGEVALTSGNKRPEFLKVPALTNAPLIVIRNYDGNHLRITNVSEHAPIQVAAYAPCYGGTSQPLPDDGKFRPLKLYRIRTGPTKNNYMQLTMKASAYTVLVTFFGAEVTVYCLAAPSPPPESCIKSTTNNRETITSNWHGVHIYMVNLSPETSPEAKVALTDLDDF